ncbi:MAG: DUF2029 domain-containing protein [Acidobacteria bacterium]|nr:DUF2029 domain-containing protein [Acidobacteriota bacterium]
MIIVLATVGILVPAGPGWDFANFYDTGARAAAGQLADIYHPERPIDHHAPQGGMASWSPPLSAYFYVPLALLPPLAALTLFKLLGTAAWMTALWRLMRDHAPHAGATAGAAERYQLLAAAGVLVFQPIWAIYRVGGQTTPFVFLLFTLALRAHVRGRAWGMAVASLTACLVKPAFALVPAWLVVMSSWRVLAALVTVAAAAGLLGLAVAGVPLHQEFLEVLRRGAAGGFPWPFNSSLYVVGESLKLAGPAWGAPVGAALLLVKVAVVAIVGHAAWTARALDVPPAARRHCHMLLAITCALLVSQVVWEHYLQLLLPLWTYLLAVRERLSPRARQLLGAALAACLMQNIVVVNVIRAALPTGDVVLATALAVAKSLPLLLTAIFLARHKHEWFASYSSPSWRERA